MMLKAGILKLMQDENLAGQACHEILDELLNPNANPLQVAAFLVLLRRKQESTEELAAIVNALREKMIVVPTQHSVLDIVGTGGDKSNSVNISTGSALLAASCGVRVAKHGNRSFSSLTGSADVLEALGVNIDLTPQQVSKSIDQIGIGFCYLPNFHPATLGLRRLRKELSIPTTFNLIGPLLNPAKAAHLLLGVLSEKLLPVMADVLAVSGTKKSIVVHSAGLDEMSTAGPANVIEINDKEMHQYLFEPLDYGFTRCTISDLVGGDAKVNASILLEVFKGKPGPVSDTIILNAAMALYIYGIQNSIHDAIQQAKENLYSGATLTLLKQWIEFSYE